jgi:hypothetical protein
MPQKDLRIFLSSPGDVGMHRDTVQDVVEGLNNDPLLASLCRLSVVRWDRSGAAIPMDGSQTAQDSVSQYLPVPAECDLTIILLWGRIGTPLPSSTMRVDGTPYQSGTIWELENARDAGKPVWIYRKTSPPLIAINDPALDEKKRQFASVTAFAASANNPDGSINFGMNTFENDEQLRVQLLAQLRWFVRKTLELDHQPPSRTDADAARNAVAAVAQTMRPAELLEFGIKEDNPVILADLSDYPIGPMIRDIVIQHLPEAIAEIMFERDPRVVFNSINAQLTAARHGNEPDIAVSMVKFHTGKGGQFFWEDVLHYAAVQGPRMLAGVLGWVRIDQVAGPAQAELVTLIRRVNCYV